MASKSMTVVQIAARRTTVIATLGALQKLKKHTFMHVGASRVNSASNTFWKQHAISEMVKLTLTSTKKNMLSKQGTALIEESGIFIKKTRRRKHGLQSHKDRQKGRAPRQELLLGPALVRR